jgi:hypothetical protein
MAPKYPSIPEPTIKPESLRDSVLTIKQAFELLTGQRGNPNYAALLPEDLLDISTVVADNTEDIAANTAAIATNTTNIATNTTAITTKVAKAGDTMTGSLTPAVNGAVNLGSASLRWGTVYTSDLDLNNGVGDWTIVEGENDLFIYNNKRGKVYKFLLYEVTPETAPPKR